MSRTLIDVICFSDHRSLDVWRVDGVLPQCPECGSPTERLYQPGSTALVIGDDIPGGLEIRHGLVHPDGSPKTFYSHSAIAREAKARGMQQFVRHAPPPGTDKSKHTQRFI